MDPKLAALLIELESLGEQNDAHAKKREDMLLNLERQAAEFIAFVVRAMRLRRILELGTSNGYSTLWLAYAVQPLGGSVTTIDRLEHKTEMARANFARSGLGHLIRSFTTEAANFLSEEAPASYDLLFLDAERPEYPPLWNEFQRVLVPGGLMIVDNAVSHQKELAAFHALVNATPKYMTNIVPVGKGELMILKPDR